MFFLQREHNRGSVGDSVDRHWRDLFFYTAIVSWVLLRVLSAIVTVRLDQEVETEGLDILLHDERGNDLWA